MRSSFRTATIEVPVIVYSIKARWIALLLSRIAVAPTPTIFLSALLGEIAADGKSGHHYLKAIENMNMWVRLESNELDLILASIPAGPLADKLKQEPHPDTAAFAGAVSTDDDLEVDEDTVISRGDDGAFVMSWVWVSNEAAGMEPEFSDDEDEAAPLTI